MRMTRLRGKADLGSGPVLSTLIQLSIPSVAMVLFHTLFHLVDTVFISWLGEPHGGDILYISCPDRSIRHPRRGRHGMIRALREKARRGQLLKRQETPRSLPWALLVCSVWIWIPFSSHTPRTSFQDALAHLTRRPCGRPGSTMWIPPTFILISFSYVVNSVFRCQGNTMIPPNIS